MDHTYERVKLMERYPKFMGGQRRDHSYVKTTPQKRKRDVTTPTGKTPVQRSKQVVVGDVSFLFLVCSRPL